MSDSISHFSCAASHYFCKISHLILFCCALSLFANIGHADEEITTLIKRVKPSVVTIKSQSGAGSGFVVFENAVVTNYHVVAGATKVDITFHDGTRTNTIKSLYIDRLRDIAILEVEEIPPTAAVLELSQTAPEQGDTVVAIGHPAGADFSVTRGIVSAVRSAEDLIRQFPGEQFSGTWIQTDAAINPGNSGGPLVGLNSQIVGMNSGGHRDAQNLNYAVSALEIITAIQVAKKAQPKLLSALGSVMHNAVDLKTVEKPWKKDNWDEITLKDRLSLIKQRKKSLEKQGPQIKESLITFQDERQKKIEQHPDYKIFIQVNPLYKNLQQQLQQLETQLQNLKVAQQQDNAAANQQIADLNVQINQTTDLIRQDQLTTQQMIISDNLNTIGRQRLSQGQVIRDQMTAIGLKVGELKAMAAPFFAFLNALDAEQKTLEEKLKEHKKNVRECENRIKGLKRQVELKNPVIQEMAAKKRLATFIKFHSRRGLKNKRDALKKLVRDYPDTTTANKVEDLLGFEESRLWHNEDDTKTITATYQRHDDTHIWLIVRGENKKVRKEKFSKYDLELLELYFGS